MSGIFFNVGPNKIYARAHCKSAQNNAQDAGPITGNIMKISP
jgi:hypothetical protein